MGSKLQPWPCENPNNFRLLILMHSKSKMTSDTNQPTCDRTIALSDQVSTSKVKNIEEKVRHKRAVSNDLATPERMPKHLRASAPDNSI